VTETQRGSPTKGWEGKTYKRPLRGISTDIGKVQGQRLQNQQPMLNLTGGKKAGSVYKFTGGKDSQGGPETAWQTGTKGPLTSSLTAGGGIEVRSEFAPPPRVRTTKQKGKNTNSWQDGGEADTGRDPQNPTIRNALTRKGIKKQSFSGEKLQGIKTERRILLVGSEETGPYKNQ